MASTTESPLFADTVLSLKLFIDKKSERRRVLYAEADKEFVDFLLSILTLPVGAVTRLLKEGGGMIGSWQSLYQSYENLSLTHIQPFKNKRFLLEPKVVVPGAKLPHLLLPNVGSTVISRLFRCSNGIRNTKCIKYVADDNSTICPTCESKMNQIVEFIDSRSAIRPASSSEDGYVKGTVTYMVMDDLEVKPLSTCSLVTLLTQFNVKEIGDIEVEVVDVGMDEVFILLLLSVFLLPLVEQLDKLRLLLHIISI
jgi:hypothetical protein